MTNQLSKEKKVYYTAIIIAAGFFVSLTYHMVMKFYFNLHYPYSTFLFKPGDRFNDFFNMCNICRNLNPYFEPYRFNSNYYPFGNLLFFIFALIPVKAASITLYSLFYIFPFIYINKIMLLVSSVKKQLLIIGIFTFLSYPFLFTVDRGNIEGLMFVCIFFSLFFFEKGKFRLCSLFLAIPIAIKVYPAVLLVYFLSEKRRRVIINTFIIVIVISVIPLFLFNGGLQNNLNYIAGGFKVYISDEMVFGPNNFLQRGVGLLTLTKTLLIISGTIHYVHANAYKMIYVFGALLLFSGVSFYVYFIEKTLWKKITLLIFSMLLFPHFSADYRLVHIFIPLYLFYDAKEKTRLDYVYLILFSILLIPKDYMILQGIVSDAGMSDISISVVINPVILITIMTLIMVTGIREYYNVYKTKLLIDNKLY
jgi:hypothetical protein